MKTQPVVEIYEDSRLLGVETSDGSTESYL